MIDFSERNAYIHTASQLFHEGYNCSQAVFAAFAKAFGMDLDYALRLSSSFGAGMGGLRETCGAVSGMFMVMGLQNGYGIGETANKAAHYKTIQKLAQRFQEEFGTLTCRELLKRFKKKPGDMPEKRTETYYKTRPCEAYVLKAVAILIDEINTQLQQKKSG